MSSHSNTNDFKYAGTSRGGASSFAVDPSTNKYIMYRKRKNKTPERPPTQALPETLHPPSSNMKHLPPMTIIELDEEQKESSPMNSVQKNE